MKIRVTMKDPDGVYECVEESLKASLPGEFSKSEKDALLEVRRDEVNAVLRKWFRFGEYLDVEVDTDAKTIRVIEDDGR